MGPSRRFADHRPGIDLVWRRGFGPLTDPAEELRRPALVSHLWRCPVCSTSVARPHRAGRAKVYCTNACRQRAYRWRCENRSRLTTPAPPQRSQTTHRTHAVRSDADFVGQLRDSDGRRVTVCGTFARVASERPGSFRHTNFYAIDHDGHPPASTCHTCVALLSVPLRPLSEILDEIDSLVSRGVAA